MSPRITAVLSAAAIALTGLAAGASGADAATTCKFENAVVEVHMTKHEDTAFLATAAGTIGVGRGPNQPITCAGGTPTANNTDSVLIVDESDNPSTPAVNDGNTTVTIRDATTFRPGKTDEPSVAGSVSEIEFYVDTGGGYDSFVAYGPEQQNITVGNYGANWTLDDDADMIGMPFDDVHLIGSRSADNNLSGHGGDGTGAPLSTAKSFSLFGADGSDRLLGSDIAAGDDIQGADGNDTIEAGAGDDRIQGWRGDDTIKGGAGSDTIKFTGGAAAKATVDLNQTGPQDTGEGRDTLTEIENVTGTDGGDDVLIGTPGPNVLDGLKGNDTLEGRDGADQLIGGEGTDATSYASAAAAVTIDLGKITQTTDGDKLYTIEDVIGSPFADTLTGNAVANRIVGGAGTDTVSAGAGADRVEVRDGEADKVSCGADADVAVSDRRTLDSIDADCESVDALPEPVQEQPKTKTPDRTLSFALKGAKTQRVLRQRSVRVQVSCPQEACSVKARVSGKQVKVGPVTKRIAAGVTTTLNLRLTKAQIAALRKAVAAGRAPVLKVSVTARDAAGNQVTRTLSVKAKG